MKKTIKYTIFKTKWGYFGIAAGKNTLLKTCLPIPNPRQLEAILTKQYPDARFEKNLLKPLQKQIIAYFQGSKISFRSIPIQLENLTPFTILTLKACRKIPFGKTSTYSKLAEKINHPNAARAIGNALAKNPLPLIIPCHRIICSDGQFGNFSAAGGKKLKQKLLQLEKTKK